MRNIFIETVKNGFIVHEDFMPASHERGFIPETSGKKVFESKDALNKYINESLFFENE